MRGLGRPWAGLLGLLGLLGLGGCPGDDEGTQNVLPTAGGSGSGTVGPDTAASTTTGADATADETAGPGASFPATYRFDCIDIRELGDGNGDGQPDGESIQATLLENTWLADIDAFKLNVLLTVRERDEDTGEATLLVGSGIGTGLGDQCVEPTTAGSPQSASFEEGQLEWQPSGMVGSCAEPTAGSGDGARTRSS